MQHRHWRETPASQLAGYQAHRMTADEPWRYPLHGHHGFCEFVYLTHGEVRHEINGNQHIQQGGELMLIREGDCHSLSGENFIYTNLMFPPSWLMRLEQFTQRPGQARRLMTAESPPSVVVPLVQRPLMRDLVSELQTVPLGGAARQRFCAFLVLTVTRYLDPVGDADIPSGLPDWLHDTVTWIHQHSDAVPTLPEVVTYSCRCQEHLTRQFTSYLGISPSRYLASLRIDRAAALLSTTNTPIQEICSQLGFDNESYFYRLFKAQKEMTPMTYRRTHGPRSTWASA